MGAMWHMVGEWMKESVLTISSVPAYAYCADRQFSASAVYLVGQASPEVSTESGAAKSILKSKIRAESGERTEVPYSLVVKGNL